SGGWPTGAGCAFGGARGRSACGRAGPGWWWCPRARGRRRRPPARDRCRSRSARRSYVEELVGDPAEVAARVDAEHPGVLLTAAMVPTAAVSPAAPPPPG